MELHAHSTGVLVTMMTSCDANKKTASRSRVCHLLLREYFYGMVYFVRVCGLVLSCPGPVVCSQRAGVLWSLVPASLLEHQSIGQAHNPPMYKAAPCA